MKNDMSFITTKHFLLSRVLPLRSKYRTSWPETAVQHEISNEPSAWGTYIWDMYNANASSIHMNGRFFKDFNK